MNRLKARLKSKTMEEGFTFMTFSKGIDCLYSIIIDNPNKEPSFEVGDLATLCFKESEVFLTKNCLGQMSVRNKMKSVIETIEKGRLFSKVQLNYQGEKIISLITTFSSTDMFLEVGDIVYGMVKTNEVSILKEPDEND